MVPSTVRADKVSPLEVLKGRKIDYRRDLTVAFGDMYEVPVLQSDNNVVHQRTQTVIAVGATGNQNGAARFFNPWTGGFSTRASFGEPLPMNEAVIKRLTDMWINDGNRDLSQFRKEPRFTVGRDRDVHLVPTILDEDLVAALTPPLRVPLPAVPEVPVDDHDTIHVPRDPDHLRHVPGDSPYLFSGPPVNAFTSSQIFSDTHNDKSETVTGPPNLSECVGK
jgi:hypothetical protein